MASPVRGPDFSIRSGKLNSGHATYKRGIQAGFPFVLRSWMIRISNSSWLMMALIITGGRGKEMGLQYRRLLKNGFRL